MVKLVDVSADLVVSRSLLEKAAALHLGAHAGRSSLELERVGRAGLEVVQNL